MAVKIKESAVYVKKYIVLTLEFAHGFACRQPFVAGFSVSLILLHTCYPNLFAFLVSSAPVLLCTALLLGTLLWYGEPYIPEIEEEENEHNWEVSSLKVENSLDDLLVKKDKNYKLEGIVDSADSRNERLSDFLTEKQDKFGQDYILERGFGDNVGDCMKELLECQAGRREIADGVSERVDGFNVAIKEPELDEWLDSSLGSPWHPINIHDAASDSESDRAESSSPDASMVDILPMLNELHPLLDSEAPKFADSSDAELSKHHESDEDKHHESDEDKHHESNEDKHHESDEDKHHESGEDSTEQEDEHKIKESGPSSKVVTWTADDHKNVMDLGSSDLERNRRLESLIARRRARKNQIIIFEQDLIDLHSNDMTVDKLLCFHPQIPHISAPRNPFDLHRDSDEFKGYPPIPGSAPSVLLHGKNPFDFSHDTEYGGSKGLAEDTSVQLEFGLLSRRGLSFRRYESFASRSSGLKPYFGATMGSEHNDLAQFEIDEETHQGIDGSGNFRKEIEGTVVVEEKHGVVAGEKHEEWTLFTSSEDNEKNLDVILREDLENRGKITSYTKGTVESVHSFDAYASHQFHETERVGNSRAAVPIYDSSPFGSGNFFADIFVPDDTQLSSGKGVSNSTFPVESHVQEDILEILSHERDFGANMISEMMEFEVVHGCKLQDSTSSNGEPVTFTSNINLLDEDIFPSKGVSEAIEQDCMENRSPGHEDFDHSSGFSSREADLNETGFTFSDGLKEKHPSLEKLEAHTSFGTPLEGSQVTNLELGPILEENLEDLMVEEEQLDFFKATITPSTGSQMHDGPNICKSSVEEKAISLHSQSKATAGDDGNEEGIALFPGKSKPPKFSNFFDGMECSDLYKMRPEYEFKSNEGISDVQANVSNEFQINQDTILMNRNDLYGVPGDDDADVRELQCFDEQFLSELDAVGDFHIESQSSSPIDSRSKDFELVSNQKDPTDSGFWSLTRSHVDDLELTVYKPKLGVLQSCSLEEFDSPFIEDPPGEFAELSLSEAITYSFELEKPHGGLSTFDMSEQGIDIVTLDAALLTANEISVEAKTIEDTDSAFNHASEIIPSKSISSLVIIPESSNSQMKSSSGDAENLSESSVLEAKSSKDMQLAFQQATEGVSTDSESLVPAGEPYNDINSTFEQFDNAMMVTGSNAQLESCLIGLINSNNDAKPLAFEKMTVDVISDFEQAHTISLESHIDNEVVDVYSLDTQIDPEPAVLDAKSTEDVNLNPALEQEIDATEKKSLSIEDKPEMFAPEVQSFEGTHLEFRDADVGDICQSTTILVDPKHSPGQKLLVEKSPDSGNDSDFHVAEAKSLKDLNSPFKQASEDYDTVKESCLDSVAAEKSTVNIHTIFTAGVYEGLSSLSAETRPHDAVECDSKTLIMESKTAQDKNSNFKLTTIVRSFDTESVSNSLVFEEDCVKLADSILKHVSEEGSTVPFFSIDPPALQVNKDEFMEENSQGKNKSELLVLEENSVKDIDSTLKQATEEQLGGSVTLQDDSKTETHSVHATDLVEVFDEMVVGRKSSNEEQMNTIIDEEEIVSEDPSSSSPTWLNMKKIEKKNEKNSETSDCSSSSSDSE